MRRKPLSQLSLPRESVDLALRALQCKGKFDRADDGGDATSKATCDSPLPSNQPVAWARQSERSGLSLRA